MSYSFNVEKEILIVKIEEKRATIEFSGTLKDDLLKKIEHGNGKVVIDLGEVEFVDSSFLGTLVGGLKKTASKNGDLKIVNLKEPVRAMFELTRLYKIFEIFDTVEDALNSF
jgi:anti-sigma B factor antagonist